MKTAFQTHFLKRFELYVTLMAVTFLTLAAGLVWADVGSAVVFGATVVGMGTIQWAIQWVDRERQKRLRAQAIAEIREMLVDQVLNQLAAIKMWMTEGRDPAALDLMFREMSASVDQVTRLINGLSEAQLDTWKLTYANVAEHVAFPTRSASTAPAR